MNYIEISFENLSIRYTKLSYEFTEKDYLTPKSNPLTGIELCLLGAANKHQLKLLRCVSKRRLARVYRLTDGNSFVDFVPSEGGMKLQKTSFDEDFAVNKLTKFAFEFGAKWIAGKARYKHELVLYSRLGFVTNPETKTFVLMAPPDASKGP